MNEKRKKSYFASGIALIMGILFILQGKDDGWLTIYPLIGYVVSILGVGGIIKPENLGEFLDYAFERLSKQQREGSTKQEQKDTKDSIQISARDNSSITINNEKKNENEKAKIEISTKKSECIHEINTIFSKARYVRAIIRNTGKTNAKNVYLKLLKILKEGKELEPFTPFQLKWPNYHNNGNLVDGIIYQDRKADLAVGESHPIDIVNEFPGVRQLIFQADCIPEELHKQLTPGSYTFKVGIYGENVESIEIDLKIKFTDNFGELNFIN